MAQAEQLYRQILQQQSNSIQALHRLGILVSQVGKHEQAIPFFQKVLALAPHFPEAHFNLASALQNRDRIEDAIAHYQRGLALNPSYPEVYLNFGAALKAQGRLKERIQDLSHQLHDFTDTAAVVSQLDLVITVDTSIAHLAGALGKSAWVLLNFDPDWRWLIGRETSPWYPSIRLFRQDSPGNWQDVFARVAESLSALVADNPPK